MCFIFQQVFWLKAWCASLVFLLSVSFLCSHWLVPALCVRMDHLARLACPALCSAFKGKRLLITIWMARGVRDWVYSNSGADSSAGSPLQCCLMGVRGEAARSPEGSQVREEQWPRGSVPRPSLLARAGAVLPQEPRGVRSVLLVLLGFRQLSLEQHSFPWALLHCAGFGHYRLVNFKRDVDLFFLHFSW